MSNTIRTISSTQNLVGGVASVGAIPQSTEDVLTDSSQLHQTTQIVGTSHEVISAGDMVDDCLCFIKNAHASAVVSVGVDVGAVFYPLFTIPAGETSKLSRLESLAGTYIKSSAVSTSVIISLYEIDPPA